MKILICYDIPDGKKRTKLAKYLESFARRIQYSVFVCDLPERGIQRVKQELSRLLDGVEGGSVYLYCICASCNRKVWQIGRSMEAAALCYVV